MTDREDTATKLAREEDVNMTIGHDYVEGQGHVVVIQYPQQKMRLGVPPDTAVQMALALIRHAETCARMEDGHD